MQNKAQNIATIEGSLIKAVEKRLKRSIYLGARYMIEESGFLKSIVGDVICSSEGQVNEDFIETLFNKVRFFEKGIDVHMGKTVRKSDGKPKKITRISSVGQSVDAYYVEEQTLEKNNPLSKLDIRLACLSKIIVEEIRYYPEIFSYIQDKEHIDQSEVLGWLKENSKSHFKDLNGLESFENPKPKDYLVYGKNWFEIPKDENNTLRKLKNVVEKLTEEYIWWDETQTIDFLLAGVTPEIPKGRVTIRGPNSEFSKELHEYSKRRDMELPYYFSPWGEAAKMIVMKLNPRLSPMEVAKIYRHSQRRIFSGQVYPMKYKNLQLALCCLEYDGTKTWKMIMEQWNAKWQDTKSEWKYTQFRNFHRDARRAWKQITGVPFFSKTIIKELKKRSSTSLP